MLETLFNPSSIAVVGASRERDKVGNIVFRNLINTFSGKVYPVNSKADSIEGVKAYRALKDIGDKVDLVVVAVPREHVPPIIEEAGSVGATSAIVITSGFRETGAEGEKLEQDLVSVARKNSVRFLGPNTLGLVTPSFNATFAYTDVIKGNIALVAQSGGIGVYMLNWALRSRLGLSYFVSLGNQADIKESEVFSYLAEDVQTRAIFSYVEGVSDGDMFLRTVPEVVKRKPLVFLKGGVSQEGAKAVKTHTGSIAGSVEVFRAAVKSTGGILVDGLEDMLNLARLITSEEPVRDEILVVTNSGGHGVLTTDEAFRRGLKLVEMPKTVQGDLRKVLPPQSLAKNPLDLSGDATRDRYEVALKAVSGLDCTKVVIVQSLPMVSCTEVAKAVSRFKGTGVVAVVMGPDEDAAMRYLEGARIPSFKFPEEAVRAISYMARRNPPARKIRVSQPPNSAKLLVTGKEYLRDLDSYTLMEYYGIKVPKWAIAKSPEEAGKVAEGIGYPIVVKASFDHPVHKTEIGGVVMNVDRQNVGEAFLKVSKLGGDVMLQEQLEGLEVYVGGKRDPVFGHVVVVGLGGIYVEVLRQVSFGLSPVNEEEAEDMMRESKVLQALTARRRGYDVGSVIRTIVAVSRMIVDLDVEELDINPLIVNERGAFAVDVRVLIGKN